MKLQDVNRKLRGLMLELLSEKKVIPRSLFITCVKIVAETNHYRVDMADSESGVVYKGEHKGQVVALKKRCNDQKEDCCREAILWSSLSHRFILPLLGIHEEESTLFLVSPWMTKGTLRQWRKNQSSPVVDEIHRLVRFRHRLEESNVITLSIRCRRWPKAFSIFTQKESSTANCTGYVSDILFRQ